MILDTNALSAIVDGDSAVVYARVHLALKKAGRPIPTNDVWIAALALQHREPVLTRDAHFDAVAGLVRLGW